MQYILKSHFNTAMQDYCKFSNKGELLIRAHPLFKNLKDEIKSFPMVYDMPIYSIEYVLENNLISCYQLWLTFQFLFLV